MNGDPSSEDAARPLRGLDSNILIRYLTLDDTEQSPLACELLDGAGERRERFFISLPVLCETLWTLAGSRYRMGREVLAEIVVVLLESPVLVLQDRALVRHALEDFRGGRAEFADYLIGRCAEAAGCSETVTFDGGLAMSPGFRLLGSSTGPATP